LKEKSCFWEVLFITARGFRRRFKETLKLNDETALFRNTVKFSVALGRYLRFNVTGNFTYDELVEK
jgi:hypothetical protein